MSMFVSHVSTSRRSFADHRHCGYPDGAYHKIDDTILEMVSAPRWGQRPAAIAVPQSTLFLEALTPVVVELLDACGHGALSDGGLRETAASGSTHIMIMMCLCIAIQRLYRAI